MSWRYPRIIAHRGGGKLAPENTLGAIRLGAGMGFRGVEFDVMLAGDGTPVLIHDETLERTAGVHGKVADLSYGRLAGLDAGSWFGRKWRGERIPTFEQAGQLCLELDLWANVEIKPARGHERATGRAAAQIARELWKAATLKPVLSSFSVEALIEAKRAAPELPRGYLVGRIPKNWRETMGALGCVALHCNHRALTKPLTEDIHAAGYAVLCWTVNDRRVARKLLGWGVDCLVTDALKRIDPAFGQ